MKKVAIFDIDGTIFRSSLLIKFTEALIDEGIFSGKARKMYEAKYVRWLDRKGSYEQYIGALVVSFEKQLKGILYADFCRIAELVVDRNKNRIYCYTRDLIEELKKKKYFLLAISNSPKIILEDFCRELGFDKIYGRMYETGAHEKFTGKTLDEHLISNKANIMRRALRKEGLTLSGSIGVGDTESDIPFLELVERPICFNPNRKLYRFAKLNRWEVVVERKDVIYEL